MSSTDTTTEAGSASECRWRRFKSGPSCHEGALARREIARTIKQLSRFIFRVNESRVLPKARDPAYLLCVEKLGRKPMHGEHLVLASFASARVVIELLIVSNHPIPEGAVDIGMVLVNVFDVAPALHQKRLVCVELR